MQSCSPEDRMNVICRNSTDASLGGTHRGRQLQLRSLPVALLEELAGHQLCHLKLQKRTSVCVGINLLHLQQHLAFHLA